MNWNYRSLALLGLLIAFVFTVGCPPPPPKPNRPTPSGGGNSSVDNNTLDLDDSLAPPADLDEPEDSDEPMDLPPLDIEEQPMEEPMEEPMDDIELGDPLETPPPAEPMEEPMDSDETPAPAEPMEEPMDSSTPSEPPASVEPIEPEESSEPMEEPAGENVKVEQPAPAAVAGDWPMWGGTINRNMVSSMRNVVTDFEPAEDPAEGKRMLWAAKLGSQTYGNPIVANGKVLVGTNNGAEYRPQHKGDKGIVLCFDEKSGEFLWQLTRDKLASGRVNDWPLQGICSSAAVDGDRVYVVTNRCEMMCLDLDGFHDGENDGFQGETDKEKADADIVWNVDMMEELGVFPHNLATSSPVVFGDMVYILSSNGVDEAHLVVPSPRAPCFLAFNKKTGEVVWEDNTPFDKILHGQWSSPCVGVVNGKAQVYFPGGDGWLYALDAKTGEHVWKCDLNPKDSKWELGGRGSRNAIISTPVFYENTVIVGVGQDPEHGEGVGHLWRIDATKTGDVSPTVVMTKSGQPKDYEELPGVDEKAGEKVVENPNSAIVWHYGGIDDSGKVTGEADSEIYRRTISTVAIADGLVYAADLSGRMHCVDLKTGTRKYEADLLSGVWGSPMVVDGKVFIGDEDGELSIFKAGPQEELLETIEFNSSIYSTPTFANGKLFVSDRSRLYCFDIQAK